VKDALALPTGIVKLAGETVITPVALLDRLTTVATLAASLRVTVPWYDPAIVTLAAGTESERLSSFTEAANLIVYVDVGLNRLHTFPAIADALTFASEASAKGCV
jgi:hypothetical protein